MRGTGATSWPGPAPPNITMHIIPSDASTIPRDDTASEGNSGGCPAAENASVLPAAATRRAARRPCGLALRVGPAPGARGHGWARGIWGRGRPPPPRPPPPARSPAATSGSRLRPSPSGTSPGAPRPRGTTPSAPDTGRCAEPLAPLPSSGLAAPCAPTSAQKSMPSSRRATATGHTTATAAYNVVLCTPSLAATEGCRWPTPERRGSPRPGQGRWRQGCRQDSSKHRDEELDNSRGLAAALRAGARKGATDSQRARGGRPTSSPLPTHGYLPACSAGYGRSSSTFPCRCQKRLRWCLRYCVPQM